MELAAEGELKTEGRGGGKGVRVWWRSKLGESERVRRRGNGMHWKRRRRELRR